MGSRVSRMAAALVIVGSLALVSPAGAAFPGANGKISFSQNGDIHVVNPDGTGRAPLIASPAAEFGSGWSPDGERITFGRNSGDGYRVAVVQADGSNLQVFGFGGNPGFSRDGTKIVFGVGGVNVMNDDGSDAHPVTDADAFVSKWSPASDSIVFERFQQPGGLRMVEADGTGLRDLTTPPQGDDFWTTDSFPSWSPDGTKVIFERVVEDLVEGTFSSSIHVVNADGTGETRIAFNVGSTPVWSPDGTKVAFTRSNGLWVMNPDGTGQQQLISGGGIALPDWQPLQRPYVRPKATGTHYTSLVQAFEECSAPNRTHGPPLAHPSCSPPVPASTRLFVGVGDGHPTPARSIGFVRAKTLTGVPGGPDDTDVRLRLRLSNVMNASDFSDYTGLVRPELTVRLTDRDGFQHQTTQDFPFGFDVPCAATASTTEGALCELATTGDAVVPGAAPEGTRAIWQLGQVKVYDGGPAGDGQDASLFAVQGVFVP